MSKSAKSVFVFGLNLELLGMTLLLVPNVLLGVFHMPSTTEVWIRVVGMLILFLGIYYILAARSEMRDFFQWTVYLRPTVILFFTVFCFTEFRQPAAHSIWGCGFIGSHLDRYGIKIHANSHVTVDVYSN